MPGDKTLVPGWFEAVEVIFRSFQVPDEIKTVLIMPYIADRVRSAIMCSGMKELPSYAQLKERILRELRLSPNEYKRLFTTAGKLREETWSQFAGRLNSYFSYYVNSRKVDTYDDLLQLVVADRLKESLPNEIKAYVALNETGEWLRPEAIAKLAECHQESNAQRVPKPYHKTDTTGDSSQSESMTPPKERGHTEYVGDTRRCFACGKQGHLARNCPETNPKLTARVKRPLDCEHAEQSIEVHDELVSLTEQHEVLDEERFVQLRSGDKRLNARVDSGADITVVRRSMATILDENQKGKVRLKGAFGHEVEADLMYVPFRLGSRAFDTGVDTLLLCAVTEQLAGEVDALLTPEDLVALREVEQKVPLVDQVDLPCDAAVLKEGLVIEACVASTQSEGENGIVESVDERSDINEIESEGCLQFRTEQKNDESLKPLWLQAKKGTHGMQVVDGMLFHKEKINGRIVKQLVLPESRRKTVLEVAHDKPVGGHFAGKKTQQRIKNSFYWPNMQEQISKYCKDCHYCQLNARPRTRDRVPITPLVRPDVPFQTVVMDCIGPLDPASSRGHKYALCLVDVCTRWPEVVCIRSLMAKAVCDALVEIFTRMGVPETVSSDQGTNFTAELTQELLRRLGSSPRFSTPEHPESNGLVERWNGTLKRMLRQVIAEHGRGWDRLVPCLLWAYREIPNETTGMSPFELMYGRAPNGPLSILKKSWTGDWTPPSTLIESADKYLVRLRKQMADMTRVVKEQAFQKANCLLMEVPVMRAPDASQPFVLSTDASDRAIGACLAQRAGDGKEYPVAFLSKKLTDPQTR
ncbi:uncharacterized protein ISCGN_005867, partial [Ixodes scapularis]